MRGLFFTVLLMAMTLSVSAQNLPHHADPSARENAPDMAQVPAMRFLTSVDFPPFNYRDAAGQLIGFHVDLSKEICDELTISCTIQAWPWEQAADALADNQGDVLLAGISIDTTTAQRFDFSSVYLMLPARFVTLADKAGGFTPQSLNGKKVATREGSAQARFLATYLPDMEQVNFDTEIDALAAMREGLVEAYFGDAMRASFWLNENIGCCAFAGEAYFNENFFGTGLAAAIPAGRGAVRQAVNFALARLHKNGKLDELYLRWFPVSFY